MNPLNPGEELPENSSPESGNQPFSSRTAIRDHWRIFLLMVCATMLIFPKLGEPALWNDEGDSVFWANSIRINGIPKAWDGREFSNEDLQGMTDNLVMVTLPWFPLYVTAGSMAVFGQTAWAARLPFALAGWATIFALYAFVWQATRDKKAALLASILLLLSVQFLLYSRNCRYYALTMLLTCMALHAFLRLDRGRNIAVFVVTQILLFYSLPAPAVCMLAVLTLFAFAYPPFHHCRRGLVPSLVVIIPCIVPWFVGMSGRWTNQDMESLEGAMGLWDRIRQMAFEALPLVPALGWVVLVPFCKGRLSKQNGHLLALCGLVIVSFLSVDVVMHSPGQMHTFGLRHFCGMIPLAAAISAVLIVTASRGQGMIISGIAVLLAGTHLGGNFLPWLYLKGKKVTPENRDSIDIAHTPPDWKCTIFRVELLGYLFELTKKNPGTVSEVCQFLNANAKPEDLVFTNYEWEAIYFHTKLRQTGKIDLGDPIYGAARRQGLPEYVFDPAAADWIVWRPEWSLYRKGRERLVQTINSWKTRGIGEHIVAKFKETIFENQPNLTQHRFPVLGCLYAPAEESSPAVVLRRDDPPADSAR